MIDGLILGGISWASIALSWWHLPRGVKNFSLRHPVASDIFGAGLTYLLLSNVSKSLVAATGAAFAGLLINLSIMFALRNHYAN